MAKPQKEASMASVDQMRAAFHERMHANHMYGLWELASQMTPHPQPKMVPYMWKGPSSSRSSSSPARSCRSARSAAHSSSSIPDSMAAGRRPTIFSPPYRCFSPARWPAPIAIRRRRSASSWKAPVPIPPSTASASTWSPAIRPDAQLGLARPRQRDKRARRLDGRPRPSPDPVSGSDVLSVLYAPRFPRPGPTTSPSSCTATRTCADVGEGEAALVAVAPLLLGRTWEALSAMHDHEGTPSTASTSSTAPADRRPGAADDGLLDPDPPRRRTPEGAPPDRQRRLLRRRGEGETIIDGKRTPGARATSWPCRPGRSMSTPTLRQGRRHPLLDPGHAGAPETGLYNEEALSENGGHQKVTSDFSPE